MRVSALALLLSLATAARAQVPEVADAGTPLPLLCTGSDACAASQGWGSKLRGSRAAPRLGRLPIEAP